MDASNSRFAIKLLPSMTDFAFLMPILYLFGRMNGLQNLLGDGDTGWHIRTGQWIAAQQPYGGSNTTISSLLPGRTGFGTRGNGRRTFALRLV